MSFDRLDHNRDFYIIFLEDDVKFVILTFKNKMLCFFTNVYCDVNECAVINYTASPAQTSRINQTHTNTIKANRSEQKPELNQLSSQVDSKSLVILTVQHRAHGLTMNGG